jgi:hypothetical protein
MSKEQESVAGYFSRMFSASRSMPATRWFKAFPPYQVDHEVGAKPWWPSLSEVWRHQGVCPSPDDPTAAHWPAAWQLLERLHEDYLSAKAAR